jgi:DNA repair exonuclease SbcCD ATPase subunit
VSEILVRTPYMIATEINSIKEQTRKMVLYNSIEIGRRLVEVKAMFGHGEWGRWLENSVDYSQSTANNLMRIFEEYGSNQIAFFGDNANSQALGNLSYTQAVALLGIPKDEREQFVEEHEIDSMTTRELQQAIKEKQELEAKLKDAEAGLDKANKVANNAKRIAEDKDEEARKLLDEKQNVESNLRVADQVLRETQGTVKMLQDALEKERKYTKSEVERLSGLLIEARKSGSSDEKLNQLEAELKEAQSKVEELTDELNKPVILEPAVIEKVPAEVERELEELRRKTQQLEAQANKQGNEKVLKFKVQFDTLVKGFGELLGSLAQIEDKEAQETFKGAVIKLIGKMQERL